MVSPEGSTPMSRVRIHNYFVSLDYLHVVVVPVTLGEGQRAYPDGLDLSERFDREFLSTPTGRTHQLWNRRT
ncbi:hypothetical protein NCCP2495_11260 [Dietzia sp. NCCP-2495]|uniref:hypothetical protein n=1 Tax=Dietzia sp. NCCP-2495 TaxID=2934675 RepID=UPI00222FAC3A|nr:hypothetical protein [Dietzia sp. NCCP-2495]GLB63248.1 hypothetical protein NCCP2495_11260 [Dietzia sp. NCCP-2495]